MKRNCTRSIAGVGAVLLALVLAGCSATVASLRENPQAYAGKTVVLKGRVERVVKVPLTDFSVYRFDDGTAAVTVFSAKTHERNEQLTLRAEVVAFPSDEAVDRAREARDRLRRFLVQNELANRARAERIAGAILRVVRQVSDSVDHVFFLVEES
jgi:hypothetical protein